MAITMGRTIMGSTAGGSNSRASPSSVRPDPITSIIDRRNSGGRRGLDSRLSLNVRRICARVSLLYRPPFSHASGRVASTRGSIAKGVRLQGRVIFLVARLIPSVLSLVVAALLTRLLKPEEYGLYALGLSIIFFLTIGVFEWLGLSLMRMAAGASRPDLLYGTIMTCFVVLLGGCVIVAGLALAVGSVGN